MSTPAEAEFKKVLEAIGVHVNQPWTAVAADVKAKTPAGGSVITTAKAWLANLEAEQKLLQEAAPPAAAAPQKPAQNTSTALATVNDAPLATVVEKSDRKAVEYDSIEDFVETVIVGMLVTVQTVQNNNWVVEIDKRLGPDGKLMRKPRSQPSIYGAKESTLPGAKPGDMYIPMQHLLPIRVTDPGTGETVDKWLDTNAGFRKAFKEHVAMNTMPVKFTLKSTGVNETYRCFIIPAKA